MPVPDIMVNVRLRFCVRVYSVIVEENSKVAHTYAYISEEINCRHSTRISHGIMALSVWIGFCLA